MTPDEGGKTGGAKGSAGGANPGAALGGAAYEVIRQRLQTHAGQLRERMTQLDTRRQEVFGRVEAKLLQADRVTTSHNCIPQDMVQLGHGRFLFGFNVQFGLKKDIELADVFAVYARDEAAGNFKEEPLAVLEDRRFLTDFRRLYNVYERTALSKFSLIDGHLYMVFRTGSAAGDIAVFKWAYNGGELRYVDGRAEGEYRKIGFPSTYDFRWQTPDRSAFRYGDHPHVSIADRVFVECVGGDLTIKVEDNTASGEGVYSEPVDDRHQKVDDAEIAYAELGHLILLRIRPYKEAAPRFIVFNEKLQTAVRVDSLGQSCVRLPEEHGLIFPDGYYLATGELKVFGSREQGFVLERVVHAASGEDSLFVFFQPTTGHYVLMPYRLIEQRVEERIVCNGFSLFPNGHLVSFRADDAPQKHHQVQLRQTPFYQIGHEPPGNREAFLYQVGNKDVVRGLSEVNEILTLARRETPYAELYTDLVRRCTTVLDAYPWLGSADGFGIDAAVRQVREAADRAVDEFAKVRRLQQEAVQRVVDIRKRCEDQFQAVRRAGFRVLNDFVLNLAVLRRLRGELITLREVRYIDVAQLTELETAVGRETDALSAASVKFLLKPESLEPYRRQANEQLAAVERIQRVAEGRQVEKAVAQAGSELEMLIEIVNSLKIEDATETTRIIDGITSVYSTLNQVKASLKKHLLALVEAEGAAQFNAQLKLLGQSASSYLDLCDSPERCDEYLNRLTVQLEELEGAFAGFDEYVGVLAERRTEFYEAFEQRKIALVEQRNRRAAALMGAAERILKVIQNRLAGFKSLEDIHSYLASDLMAAKVRETVEQLLALGDSVKADDLQGRLKSVQQEAVRQLKDRQELFVDGSAVIQLGKHRFNINTQPLDLTVVMHEGAPHFHLTSTRYFDPITDPAYLATREVWNQEAVSENAEVYRGEHLAWQYLRHLEDGRGADRPTVEKVMGLTPEARLVAMQEFMGTRYQDGYTKGVHDLDGERIFEVLAKTHLGLERARYHPVARSMAAVYWLRFCPVPVQGLWRAKLEGFAERNRIFPGDPVQQVYIRELQALLTGFARETGLYPEMHGAEAGDYLFHELTHGGRYAVTREADRLASAFGRHLAMKASEEAFAAARLALTEHPASELQMVRDWVRGFLLGHEGGADGLEEVTALVFCGEAMSRHLVDATLRHTLEGMRGAHGRIDGNRYAFDYLGFIERLRRFEAESVPRFEAYHRLKSQLMDAERRRLRLDEFRPRVLSSFVRNELTDRVYLPLMGDNLAKQLGAAGSAKRTDLMGLLLLVSPPGYGKTTLLEYVASRLGIVFIKVNGPAIGHAVTSLDPEEAPNAAAREEIRKLNLAFEMGDNAMICIDDIQHCNPEFLQKFISLCDGQRKIEGVWRGQPRTYDLRGRKVVVVMAGNPYTESGTKFRIPDMLANRADTYNLGDVIGTNAEWFKASYIENAVTSNAVLSPLATRSQGDIRRLIRMAETGETSPEGLEIAMSSQELEEVLSVMRKLVSIRDVIMRVNQEYIDSAAQADEFRTEPAFKLQGSYRNMNRLAEKVVAILNDDEVMALVVDHYRGESQTLTSGAEANLLKFRQLIGIQTPEETARWEEIRKTFRRNQFTRGTDTGDPVGRVVAQLAAFQGGLESIQGTLESAAARPAPAVQVDLSVLGQSVEGLRKLMEERWVTALVPAPAPAPVPEAVSMAGMAGIREGIGEAFTEGMKALGAQLAGVVAAGRPGEPLVRMDSLMHELEMIHSTLATLKDLSAQQRDRLRDAQELLALRARQGTVELEVTQEMLGNERAFLERVHEVISQAQRSPEKPEEPPPLPPRS